MTSFRWAEGGPIDRRRPLRFTFDGRVYFGCAGDTLASALLANGVHLVARSFKYHRPRGIMSAGSDEPNALVTVTRDAARRTPNLRATQVELYDGLIAESQNRLPSLRFDLGAAADIVSPLLPAGFYYKTFMWPRRAWATLYEPAIRAAAGLGRVPALPDPDRYTQRFAHCEVLVIGAGPAGLAAALAASRAGVRVILCDEQAELGGSLLAAGAAMIDGVPAEQWRAETIASLDDHPDVTLLPRTTAFGAFPDNLIGLVERATDHLPSPSPVAPRERLWQVRARDVVLAAGALERPMVFPDNDRPGVMLADAARVYAGRYGVRAGTRAVICASHDSGYDAAAELRDAGIEIAAIVDTRAAPPGDRVAAARAAGIEVHAGRRLSGTHGRLRVAAAMIGDRRIACDLVLMAGGWTPTVHLFSQARGTLRFDAAIGAFVPDTIVARVACAGACGGRFGMAEAIADGAEAGARAAAGARGPTTARSSPASAADAGDIAVPPGKSFVDFQNDVTAKDLTLALREGFRSIEHLKRYTTTGMATDQGKTSNINALGIAAATLGKSIEDVGLTTFRMPYTPVTFGALAGTSRGELFDPVRTTPIHDWATAHGAVFEDVGTWKRARTFPRAGEDMHEAVARECLAVRNAVGIFDASTLGKIEVAGPDAAKFLDLMYINGFTPLAPGRCRYGVMLREDGFILDDGVIGRLAPDRFHVTTTTGGAAHVLAVMEDYLQTEWPSLDVWLTSVTEQWAVIAVQGPRARDTIAPLVSGIDLARERFAHMSVGEGCICNVPMRLFRVSFSGELGFEINVPSSRARAVWDAVLASGAAHGITPYGTEAMHVLRAEKGYIIVGQETDGTATPDDVGFARAIGKSKRDFVGRRSLRLPAMCAPGRKQLVGLLTEHQSEVLEEGAQIVADTHAGAPMRSIGHVTSSYFSAALGRSIALAMIEDGRARIGGALAVPMADRIVRATVAAPVFYDPDGARLDA